MAAPRPPAFSYDPLADLVIQCGGCLSVLSDSRELVCRAEVEDAQLLAVRGALTAAAGTRARLPCRMPLHARLVH